jgi:D-sedoheptulose 7-phosphate isomerase
MSTVTPETPTDGRVAPDTARGAIRELAETARAPPTARRRRGRGATLVRDTVRAGGRSTSAATAAAPPTRSTSRPSTWCATAATGARTRPWRSPPTRRCSRVRQRLRLRPRVRAAGAGALPPGDLLVIHSTSGNSPNVLLAAARRATRARGARALGARRRRAPRLADQNVIIPTDRTDRAQELHLCVGHLICDLVEAEL